MVKEVGKPAEVKTITLSGANTKELEAAELKAYQKLVGGYVEMIHVTQDVKILCNEEGLLYNLPHNIERFVGTILFVGERDANKGLKDGHSRLEEDADDMKEWCSLNEVQQRKALAWCKKYEGIPYKPPESTAFRIITDPAEMDAHRRQLRAEAQAKLREWENL